MGRHRRRRTGRQRWVRGAGVAAGVLLVAVAADVAAMGMRLQHFEVTTAAQSTGQPAGRSWLIVGSDSRADLAVGTDAEGYGSADQVQGRRADMLLLVRQDATGSRAVSIPRDLMVRLRPDLKVRLALALQDGPQGLADGICNTLGVAVTDLVIVNFRTFADAVDAVGGVQVTVPVPIRDTMTGLDIREAGTRTLDGVQALALVRSRQSEVLVDGRWTAETDAAGSQQRADWGGAVLSAFAGKARSAVGNPVAAQRLAWTLTGGLQVSSGLGLADLIQLRGVDAEVPVLPTDPDPNPRLGLRRSGAATVNALRELGYTGRCSTQAMQGYVEDADGRVRRVPG